MKEKLQPYLDKIKAFFGKLSKKTRILLLALSVVLVVALVVFAALRASKPYTVLFTGLTTEEATDIAQYLTDNAVADYRIEGSDTILVPKEQEAQLKAQLLMAGYPKSGFAYDTYLANVGPLSTEADRKTAFLFDLQDRMSAVIRCLDGVKDARVTIAEGEDRRYILDSENMVPAAASVMVTMDGGQKLTGQQATAIRNLVSHGVKGLTIDNIAISDSLGNTYSGGDGGTSADASALKLQLEEQVNNSVRTNVMQVLIPFFGADNVKVSVKSTVDVNHVVGDSTTYTEPAWAADGSTGGRGIIGSRIYDNVITKEGDTAAGGTVGTETNADINTYVENQYTPDGTESLIQSSGQEDYNVDTAHEQVERTAGVVSDLMISVSINSEAVGNANLTTLQGHIARAAGIGAEDQASKISIVPLPFFREDTPGIVPQTLPQWMLYAGIGGLVLLLVLLVLISVLRRKKKRRRKVPVQPMLAEQPLPATKGADIMNVQSEKSMELRKEIRDFADASPEIAAQMVKGWLKGDDESNA